MARTSSLAETKESKKAPRVRFDEIVRVVFTYSKQDYDRSSIQVDKLSFHDYFEILAMKEEQKLLGNSQLSETSSLIRRRGDALASQPAQIPQVRQMQSKKETHSRKIIQPLQQQKQLALNRPSEMPFSAAPIRPQMVTPLPPQKSRQKPFAQRASNMYNSPHNMSIPNRQPPLHLNHQIPNPPPIPYHTQPSSPLSTGPYIPPQQYPYHALLYYQQIPFPPYYIPMYHPIY